MDMTALRYRCDTSKMHNVSQSTLLSKKNGPSPKCQAFNGQAFNGLNNKSLVRK